MAMNAALLPEFEQEMSSTRRTLERIPEDKFGWKPHEKSMALGRLAGHLAEIPHWAVVTLQTDSLDLSAGGAPTPLVPTSRQQVLDVFDANVAAARQALSGTADETFGQKWTLLMGGKAVVSNTKLNVFRAFVLSHTIHHRAQLGVYLRLNDVAVPSIYGPSADEAIM